MFWRKIRAECFKNFIYFLSWKIYIFHILLLTSIKNKPSGSCPGLQILINFRGTQPEGKYGASDQPHGPVTKFWIPDSSQLIHTLKHSLWNPKSAKLVQTVHKFNSCLQKIQRKKKIVLKYLYICIYIHSPYEWRYTLSFFKEIKHL